jgi:ubiquinone/menaquinone biosynthesis C-methylase UbiE
MNLNNWLWPLYSKVYDSLLSTPLYQDLLDQVVNLLHLDGASTLLDAGCGTGNLVHKVVSRDKVPLQIEAVDRSSQMLDIATKKVRSRQVQFKLTDLNQRLNYPDCTFDRIAMVHVLYALADPLSTLQELHRVLRRNGILIIANPRKGASVSKIMSANLSRLNWMGKITFLVRTSLVSLINIPITKAASHDHYHFLEKSDWEIKLDSVGFSDFSIISAYGEQDYLIVAVKGKQNESTDKQVL